MKLRTLFWLSVITGCLLGPIVQGQSVNVNGHYDPTTDTGYTVTETVGWYNGHRGHNSAYGDGQLDLGDDTNWASSTWNQTTIRHGVVDDSFFLYIEAPLAAKGMEWSADAENNIADYWKYVLGGQLLHDDEGKTNSLDFANATGSEKLEFLDGTASIDGKGKVTRGIAFTADFPGGVDTKWGLKDSADSIAYIIAEGLGTDKESNNPNVAMAFEFEFALVYKDEILETLQNGVVFHLSPEKVPEPSSALLLSVASIGMLLRRKR